MKARSFSAALSIAILMVVQAFVAAAQTEGGGRAGGSGTGGSTYKPKFRPIAKHTVPKKITRPGKTAAQYLADANAFYDQKDYDSALAAYQSAVSLRPLATSYYRIGWIQNDFGEFQKALAALDQATSLDPTLSSAYLEKGYALRRLKRLGEAGTALRKCVSLNPQSALCHNELGQLYYGQKQYSDAVAMLTTATSLKPDFGDAFEHLGLALSELGRNDEAIDALNRAIELEPEDSGGYMGLGDVYYYGTKDYAKAADAYIKGLQYDSKNSVAAYNVGWASNDLGNYSQALTYLDMATRSKPDLLEAYNEMGFAYMQLKRYSEAESALERAVSLDNKNAIAHYYLGQVYNITNNRSAALSQYRVLQQLGSDYADKLYKMINP